MVFYNSSFRSNWKFSWHPRRTHCGVESCSQPASQPASHVWNPQGWHSFHLVPPKEKQYHVFCRVWHIEPDRVIKAYRSVEKTSTLAPAVPPLCPVSFGNAPMRWFLVVFNPGFPWPGTHSDLEWPTTKKELLFLAADEAELLDFLSLIHVNTMQMQLPSLSILYEWVKIIKY